MEEEHSSSNNNSNETNPISLISNSRRLQIRQSILRQTTTTLRSSPYNPALSNLRRRQTSRLVSQTINHENDHPLIETNVLPIDEEEIEMSVPETNIIQNDFLATNDDETAPDQFPVLLDLSNASPVDLIITNGKFISAYGLRSSEINHADQEQNDSYHSLSTIDFDPDEFDEDDDDDDDHRFYYTSTSIPVFDYSPSTVQHNLLDTSHYRYHDEYSPSIDPNIDDEEDLSIEIILESSQNNSLPIIPIPTPRRRRSIIPSNIRTNRGLCLTDILSIPQKIYGSLKEQLNDKYQQTTIMNTQCYICLEDFQSIDSIKILNCQHVFHTGCINEWLRNHSNCAYCRTDILRSSSSTTTERRRTRRNHHRSSTNESSSTYEEH